MSSVLVNDGYPLPLEELLRRLDQLREVGKRKLFEEQEKVRRAMLSDPTWGSAEERRLYKEIRELEKVTRDDHCNNNIKTFYTVVIIKY